MFMFIYRLLRTLLFVNCCLHKVKKSTNNFSALKTGNKDLVSLLILISSSFVSLSSSSGSISPKRSASSSSDKIIQSSPTQIDTGSSVVQIPVVQIPNSTAVQIPSCQINTMQDNNETMENANQTTIQINTNTISSNDEINELLGIFFQNNDANLANLAPSIVKFFVEGTFEFIQKGLDNVGSKFLIRYAEKSNYKEAVATFCC